MCYHDLPTEFPPLQLGHWRAVERHTEIASAAVEPRVWR